MRERVALGSEDSVDSQEATLDNVRDPSADWGDEGEIRIDEKSLDILLRERFSSQKGEVG